MVLEKDEQLAQKVVSDANMNNDSESSEEIQIQKQHSFDVDPMRRVGDDGNVKKVFKASTKKKI